MRKYCLLLAISMLMLPAKLCWPQAESPAELFAHKCAQCHSIGHGRMVGPDLKDITRTRSRAWLEKFIQDPEAMMNSGDKDALALRNQYGGITMPQMNVTSAQIRQLLQYIAQQSKSGAQH
jgi:cytochrome c2